VRNLGNTLKRLERAFPAAEEPERVIDPVIAKALLIEVTATLDAEFPEYRHKSGQRPNPHRQARAFEIVAEWNKVLGDPPSREAFERHKGKLLKYTEANGHAPPPHWNHSSRDDDEARGNPYLTPEPKRPQRGRASR
jgi:hypothetical protein